MKTLGFIGAGNMARAFIESVLSRKLYKPSQIIVSARSADRLKTLVKELGVRTAKNNQEVVDTAKIIFLCMKPQDMENAMKDVEHHNKLFVSILAGVTLKSLAQFTGSSVIRVMPNMNCIVGEGAGLWFSASSVSQAKRKSVLQILECGGIYGEFEEGQFDVLTALSGCGPAFLCYFLQAMIDWSTKQGIPPKAALGLGVQAMAGTGIFLREKRISPNELITMAASKKGVTQEGLNALDKHGTKCIISEMMDAAKKRSEELSHG